MLVFCLCLLGMFTIWLLGHVIGFMLYLLILFVGHLLSYWYLYGPLFAFIGLCNWIGISNLVTIMILAMIILTLMVILVLVIQRHQESCDKRTKKP